MSDTYEHSDYPRMLYRKGGAELIQGLPCETMVVEAAEHEGMVHADGWRRTPAEAHGKEAPTAETLDAPTTPSPEAEAQLAESRERIAELEGMIDERDARISTLVDENEEMKALLEEVTGPKDPDEPAEDEPTEPEPEAARRRGRPPKVRELADA